MRFSIDLPEIKPLSEVNDIYLKELIISALYNIGKLSEKEARTILGKTRREFENLLPQFGFSILSDSPENINLELEA